MFKTIIAALDHDEHAEEVLDATAAIAGSAHVEVVHIHDLFGSRPDAEALMQAAVDHLAQQGVESAGQLRVVTRGRRAEEIAEAEADQPADLIVMGSHGRSDLAALVLGSVGHQAMQRSGAPFLFLRGEFAAARLRSVRAGGRVLVAVNGSESPAELAELVKTIAPGSRALVFHVREMAVAEAMTYVEPADDGAAIVEAVARALMSRGVQAESIAALETESVPKRIVRQAKDYRADLIVVGSRRLSSAAGLLLGSVAHEVIHLADRPVLVAGRLNARVTAARRAAAMAPA